MKYVRNVIQSNSNSHLLLGCKNRETKLELFLLLLSLNFRVNVDAFRMNISKWGTFGMMSDVIASGVVKVTGNHSAFVCRSFVLGQIITQQQSHVASTCTEFGILV
jgi:hypothetical protein